MPSLRSNGNAPQPGRVYLISGMCQDPSYRLQFQSSTPDEFCLIYLGAAGFGGGDGAGGGDPYFVLRRRQDEGAAVAALRVEWEGVFSLLSNDDDLAEELYRELIEPSVPEEVKRLWSDEPANVAMFVELLGVV